MMMLVWIVVGIVGTLVLAGVVLAILGRSIPEGHVISVTLRIARPIEAAWNAVHDVAAIPSWDQGVDRVERLPDRNGHEVWRWHMGRNRLVLETTRDEAPRLLVREITDEAKFFGGDWTFELFSEGVETRLVLTEHGKVFSAIPRAMMKYLPFIAPPEMYVKRHLDRLARGLGEEPRIEVGERRIG